MRFAWKDFLDLARQLGGSPRGDTLREAKLRSAISRAYYASYNLAAAYYRKRYRRTPSTTVAGRRHQDLYEALKASQKANERQAGDNLSTLRAYRRDADYQVARSPSDWHVAMSLQLAKDIIKELQV